ncbi:MmcQ/YjbR family DNA-binding protein [Pseudotenacibaculum haliotis]|uniref:MmcQ/YjbR family DNA-binding protein n=1 Tax=Pseudotenacibaculum haliotis TaxID=1862138 RepID=A0ABW5LVX4_9FLAO
MNIEQLRTYCISKKATTEEFPFDNDTLVFKVLGKMFAMVPLDRWERGKEIAIFKLDPEWTIELRESYDGVIGGFQQGRKPDARYVRTKHWNTVEMNKDVSDTFLEEIIDHSYDLVVSGFTKKMKAEFDAL